MVRLICALILVLAITANAQQRPTVTLTVVKSSLTTTTVINPTFSLCASLVNATTSCRRRRNYWIDTPVVIALDDDMDEQISQFFSKPTNVFQVEPTQVPVQFRTNTLESNNNPDYNQSPATFHVLQPSLLPYYYNSRVAEPFFFNAFANALSSLIQGTRTVFTTVTSQSTSTINLFFTTATRPFIIQGCIPANLPFSRCA